MTIVAHFDWDRDEMVYHTNGTTPDAPSASQFDADLDVLYSWVKPPTPAPAPCPEACLSITLKGRLNGVEALLTARGQSVEEFRRNVEAIKGLLDPVSTEASLPAPTQGQGEGWCGLHQGFPQFWSKKQRSGASICIY